MAIFSINYLIWCSSYKDTMAYFKEIDQKLLLLKNNNYPWLIAILGEYMMGPSLVQLQSVQQSSSN